ncbi:MAG: lipopolysaccharide biosynthesis protein [Planctomycetota bacterium]|nr:lipopolysaccharide biosynthesis protein [Planctomycetota bacterium]
MKPMQFPKWLLRKLDGLQGSRRHVLLLAGGSAAAQAIGIVTLILSTRFFGATSYGYAATFIGLVGMVAPFAALRYDLAIVIADTEHEASVMFWLCLVLSMVIAVLSAVLIAVIVGVLAVPPYAEMGWTVMLAALLILGQGITNTLTAWNNRLRLYRPIVWQRVLCSIASLVVVAIFAVLHRTEWMQLALSMLIATGFGLFVLATAIHRGGHLPSISGVGLSSLWSQARRHAQFPLYNLPMTAMDQITAGLPIPFLAASFGPAVAANYALANNVLRAPASWVSGAVGQVFFERASRSRHDRQSLRSLLHRSIRTLFLIFILPAALLLLTTPWLFPGVFGPSYGEAGHFAQAMLPLVFLGCLFSPVSTLPSVLGRQGTHLAFSSVACAGRVLAIPLASYYQSPMLLVAVMVSIESVTSLAFATWIFFLVRPPDDTPDAVNEKGRADLV